MVAGFVSALRTASLADLLFGDVEFTPKGVIVTIRKEKQDQEGKGRLIGLPYGKHHDTCPVRCLNDWIERRGSWPGPLFPRSRGKPRERPMGAERFCLIVQACVNRIGLAWRNFGGHSLRAGFITEAGEAGVSDLLIASQSGHADMDCLRRYFRRRDVFRTNPAASLDL
jgi:integrase